jgi:DNA-binding IclR family transcriptional regulator
MVLRFLAAQPDPVPLDRLAGTLELPRSTAYHLVNAMIEQGFVTHIAEERRYCLGVAAFEVGIGYARQAPLQRIAHRPLAALVDRIKHSAHLAVPHGREVLYVLEERAPGRAPLVTDVGVRLPAHLTASGRAIMAAMPPNQVRALYPDKSAFVDRHGRGPQSPRALRGVLTETRQRGYATEDGEVTPGFASVAAAVLDHNGTPLGGIATTYETRETVDLEALVEAVSSTARAVSRRLGAPARPGE